MKNTTLCYVEADDHYLMMHRTKKDVDENKGKWIGVGGKFLEGESPEECLCREVLEETGLVLTNYRFRGIVTFISDRWGTEYMHLFTADGFYPEGEEEEYYAALSAYQEELERQKPPRYSYEYERAREEREAAEAKEKAADEVKAEEKSSASDTKTVECGEQNTSDVETVNAETADGETAKTETADAETTDAETTDAETAKKETAETDAAADDTEAESETAKTAETENDKATIENRVMTLADVKLKECAEGELRWVHKDDLFQLNLWEGDRYFLKLLLENAPFFTMSLLYQGDDLVDCETRIYP